MNLLLSMNRYLIALFGIVSGVYKVAGGSADIELFGYLGMSPTAVAVLGAIQALAAAAIFPPRTRRVGAVVLTLTNAIATSALFAAGVQPFGFISIAFIAMAALVFLRPQTNVLRSPEARHG